MVAFHQYAGLFTRAKQRGEAEGLSPSEWLSRKYIQRAVDTKNPGKESRNVQACCEYFWYEMHRPYYNVWPSVLRMLLETDLEIACRHISLPLPSIAINIPHGSGLPFTSLLTTIYDASFEDLGERGSRWRSGKQDTNGIRRLAVAMQMRLDDLDYYAVGGLYLEPDRDFSTYVEKEPTITLPATLMSNGAAAASINIDTVAITNAFRIIVGVSLLANDPTFVEPVILNRDLLKYENASEEVKRRIEARARKVQHACGHHIGRKIEQQLTAGEKDTLEGGSSPHIRRPHFCIFWTGKGRVVPSLQLRRGAIVQPRKLTEIPTGYLDDEEVKV